MRQIPAAILLTVACFSCVSASADDNKKEMTVVAGRAAQQINNHPWSRTTPGNATTNCTGMGTVDGKATDWGLGTTDIHGTVDTNTNCNTTYTPPKTVSGNRITVDNAAWVTDVQTGDEHLIQCTAGWVGSKCSYLASGRYKAELKGNSIWITGMKGMKEMTAKYHVLQYVPHSSTAPTPDSASTIPAYSPSPSDPAALTGDARFRPSTKGVEIVQAGAGTPAASAAVSSIPSGADIYLDGNFVGNTPSTLNVAGGIHSIILKKNGFQDWMRQMSFSGGTITLSADLVAGAGAAAPVSTSKTEIATVAAAVPASFSVQPVESKKTSATASTDVPRSWIGISTKHFLGGGAVVIAVVADGPAAQAGLKAGDVINEVNGISLKDEDLDQKIAVCKPGTKVRIGYMRGAWAQEATVTVGTNTK